MKDSVPTAVPRKKKTIHRNRRSKEATPALRFSPYAWSKLLFLRDCGDTEVGGFGISAEKDLLLIEDVRLIGQHTTLVSVQFDDEAVADYFDEQVDAGLSAERCFRLWLHTHPGDSAAPSSVDEETFERVFGRCDWAVMAILACGGETYARLRFNTGPGGQIEIPVRIDYARPFPAADPKAWQLEYDECVHAMALQRGTDLFDEDFRGWPESDVIDLHEFQTQGSVYEEELEPLFAAE